MKILTLHCDYIKFRPVKKAVKKAEEIKEKEPKEIKECLVVFTAVEKSDEHARESIIKNFVENVKEIAENLKVKNIVVYPYVHLTSEPSSADFALNVLKEVEKRLSSEFKVMRAPFGWYKQFELKCKGHPLSELSRVIEAKEKGKEERKAEKEEKKAVLDKFLIITPDGTVLEEDGIEEIENDEVRKRIVSLIAYEKGEIRKERKSEELLEPLHMKIAKKLKIAEHEAVSDAGCFRFLPNGAFLKEAIRRLAWKHFVEELNCLPISTPVIIKKEDPGVLWLIEHFPERHYKVLSGKEKAQEFFLRTAGDYCSFSIHRSINVSYKNLPLALYENERDYRYEQRGELRGLYRIREFEMHNIHAVCKDENQGFDFFKEVFGKIIKTLKAIGCESDAFLFYCKSEIYKNYEPYLLELAKTYNVPVIVELLKEVSVYMAAWIDFIVFDSLNRPMEVGTAQLDFISSKKWNITFIDKDNKEKNPVIVHSGFGTERAIAAMFEIIARKDLKKATLPFWLSPVQVRVVPVSEKYLETALDIARELNDEGIRTDVDDRQLHVEKKIFEAEQEWIPYVVCIGKKEIEKEVLTVRTREKGMVEEMKPKEFKEMVKKKQEGMIKIALSLPLLLSKRPRF